ncbi:MAG TPA: DinB family protein [Acidimicrobiales bacterium]|nr:DinB family protein [Acidimicrobiales bacterium]
MGDVDEQGRPEPPLAAGETATLIGFLDFQRATLAWKCSGLDAAGLRATVGASSMTLGGLLKHMALVEEHWFWHWLHGRDPRPPWDAVDWKADPDWEWRSAAGDSPEQLLARWREAVATAGSGIDEALADGGLDRLARRTWPDGRAPSLRWILCHMVEEYARHNGHADLLREAVTARPASSPAPPPYHGGMGVRGVELRPIGPADIGAVGELVRRAEPTTASPGPSATTSWPRTWPRPTCPWRTTPAWPCGPARWWAGPRCGTRRRGTGSSRPSSTAR